jgi:hypothetical protein
VVLGFVLLAAGMRWTPAVPLVLSACLLPLGLGIGLLFPIITVVSQRASPAPLMGIATAVPVMLRSLGGAVGVALLTTLFAEVMHTLLARHPSALAEAAPHALQAVWACAAGAGLLGVLASLWLPDARTDNAQTVAPR